MLNFFSGLTLGIIIITNYIRVLASKILQNNLKLKGNFQLSSRCDAYIGSPSLRAGGAPLGRGALGAGYAARPSLTFVQKDIKCLTDLKVTFTYINYNKKPDFYEQIFITFLSLVTRFSLSK